MRELRQIRDNMSERKQGVSQQLESINAELGKNKQTINKLLDRQKEMIKEIGKGD